MLRFNGAYKVDIYNENRLTQSSDFQSNFITSTGLSYLFDIPFADCFLKLSIGSGTTINTVNTTSLEAPYEDFTSLGSYVKKANGFIENVSGMELYRAWLVSGVTGELYSSGLPINEIGVSPGEYGSEASGILFSRLVPSSPLTVPSGDYSIITYRLDIGLPTGIKNFNGLMNDSLVNTVDSPVCGYWSELSGKYSVIHNGLQTINPNGKTVEEGDSSLFGNPMEPAQKNPSLIRAYLSTDNQEFVVNWRKGGKIATGDFQPWSPTGFYLGTGLMQYNYSLDSAHKGALVDARRDERKLPLSGNIREEDNYEVFQADSSITTITEDPYTPTGRTRSTTKLFSWPSSKNQFQDTFGNDRRIKSLVLSYGKEGTYKPFLDMIFATSGGLLHYLVNTATGNFRDVWASTGVYSLDDVVTRLGATYARISGHSGWGGTDRAPEANTGDYWNVIDGRHSRGATFSYNTGNSLTGDYVFIDPYNNLSLSFRHSWSSPCPDDVSGCPGYS